MKTFFPLFRLFLLRIIGIGFFLMLCDWIVFLVFVVSMWLSLPKKEKQQTTRRAVATISSSDWPEVDRTTTTSGEWATWKKNDGRLVDVYTISFLCPPFYFRCNLRGFFLSYCLFYVSCPFCSCLDGVQHGILRTSHRMASIAKTNKHNKEWKPPPCTSGYESVRTQTHNHRHTTEEKQNGTCGWRYSYPVWVAKNMFLGRIKWKDNDESTAMTRKD